MIVPASSEFITLCKAQMALMSQVLGAASTIIYLAEQSANALSPVLIPVVAYPEAPMAWGAVQWPETIDTANLLPESWEGFERGVSQPEPGQVSLWVGRLPQAVEPPVLPSPSPATDQPKPTKPGASPQPTQPPDPILDNVAPGDRSLPGEPGELRSGYQMVLPLVHEGVVLGVLVSTRQDHPWQREEQQQAERIVDTLTLACILDQRGQWLEQRLHRKQLTQSHQSETFHDLLHQFRNPLTALRTFGKLLLKRMQVGDANQPIVEGILRESERLQDLVQYFDQAVATGDEDLQETAYPPSMPVLALPAATEQPLLQRLGQGVGAVPEPSVAGIAPGKSVVPAHHLGDALHLEAIYLETILQPLVFSADAIAQDKHIRVMADIPAQLPAVWADRGALREVISNLLDNALKYSSAGATVWVRAGLFQESVPPLQGVAIGDTGPGIPQGDQARIFERHYRGVQAVGTIAGTGLGLAIAHDLVKDMGGRIDLISPAHLSGLVPEGLSPRPRGEVPGSGQGSRPKRDGLERDRPERDVPERDLPERVMISQSPSKNFQGPGTVFIVWIPEAEETPSIG